MQKTPFARIENLNSAAKGFYPKTPKLNLAGGILSSQNNQNSECTPKQKSSVNKKLQQSSTEKSCPKTAVGKEIKRFKNQKELIERLSQGKTQYFNIITTPISQQNSGRRSRQARTKSRPQTPLVVEFQPVQSIQGVDLSRP